MTEAPFVEVTIHAAAWRVLNEANQLAELRTAAIGILTKRGFRPHNTTVDLVATYLHQFVILNHDTVLVVDYRESLPKISVKDAATRSAPRGQDPEPLPSVLNTIAPLNLPSMN